MIWRRKKNGLDRDKANASDAKANGDAGPDDGTGKGAASEMEVGPAPTDPRGAIVGGLIVLAVTFGGFGTWTAVAQLSSAVVSQGTVKVLSDRKQIQHLEGGIVKSILVDNGDAVKTGDVLVRLDKTEAQARADIIRSRYYTARATIARLEAERDDAPRVAFPDELEKLREDKSIAETLRGQEKLFEARRASLGSELKLLREKVGQLKEEIRGVEAEVRSRTRQITLIRDELKGLRELHKKGYAPLTRILALEREQARLNGERGQQKAQIARAQRMIGETKLQIIQKKQSYREKVITDLRDQQSKLADLQEQKRAADITLARTDIRATADGLVVGMQIHAEGQVVQPGKTILEIVPTNDTLIVEAPVRPIDRDDVLVGQPAEVLFTAFSRRTTPKVKGKVVYISADSMVDQRSGMPFYVTRVAVPDSEVKRLGMHRKLEPGMPADIFIETGARTPLNYLLKPLTDSLSHAWREP